MSVQPQPYKLCPRCQQTYVLDTPVCQRCGHQFRTQFQPPPDRTIAMMPGVAHAPPERTMAVHPATEGRPRVLAPERIIALIATMWALTLASVALFGPAPPLALALDAGALGIAIYLVCVRTRAARINGWVKIGLEVLGLLAAMIARIVADELARGR